MKPDEQKKPEETVSRVNETSVSTKKLRSGKKKNLILAGSILFLGIVLAGVILTFKPISNYFVIKNANTAMISLAQQAGMSKQGELVFLAANPKFATDAQMSKDCAGNAAANNKNGFIEQGCYVPNPRNHSIGRIYIRQMPANLYREEIVTAAYEMLHSVYFKSQSSQLVMSIESNYNQLRNATLSSQVVNFAQTEPGYRDLELFSLIGTEFNNLSAGLARYYAPYFTNRSLTVDSYNTVTATFQNEQNQLKKIQQTITADDSLANKAYADSLAWAKTGNAYEDSYDYGIYKNYIAQENSAIKSYNQLSQAYNTLVTEYNGTQPVTAIKSVSAQSSK